MEQQQQVPHNPIQRMMPNTSFALVGNRDILKSQIQDCITTIATMTNCIRIHSIPNSPDAESSIPQKDEGYHSEKSITTLEESLFHACQRLDALMKADERWVAPPTDAHTLAIKYFTQQIMLQQQAVRSNEIALEEMKIREKQATELLRQEMQQEVYRAVQQRLNELEKLAEDEAPKPAQ